MYEDDESNIPAIRDGFDDLEDEGNTSALKGGHRVTFTLDYQWVYGKGNGEVIEPERELLVLEYLKLEQKWILGQKRPETKFLRPKEKFRDIEALNKKAPRSEWREVHGKMIGPWEAARAVYLIDLKTMERFTYINRVTTIGGDIAIRELRDSSYLARRIRGGAQVYPVVTLGDTFMPTKHGGRQRPYFKIVRFEALGAQEAPQQLERTGPVMIEGKVESADPTPHKKSPRERKLEKEVAELKAKLETAEAEEEADGEDEAMFDEGAK